MKKNVKVFNEGNFTRMCGVCGARRHKNEMMRVARSPEGAVYIDETGKGKGRGCYICKNRECVAPLKKSGRLSRALKCEIPEDIYGLLGEKAEQGDE